MISLQAWRTSLEHYATTIMNPINVRILEIPMKAPEVLADFFGIGLESDVRIASVSDPGLDECTYRRTCLLR